MKITDVKTFLVHDEKRPERNYTFVKIYTDEGLTGLGEAGVTWKELAVQALVDTYRPILVGMDPSRIEHIWQTLWRGQFFRGGHIHSAAVAAIDLALWDLRGKVLGAPVYDLLGGRVRDYARCYCHVQGSTEGATYAGIAQMVEYAKQQVAHGWRFVRFGAGETRGLMTRAYWSRPTRSLGRSRPSPRYATPSGRHRDLRGLPSTDHACLRRPTGPSAGPHEAVLHRGPGPGGERR